MCDVYCCDSAYPPCCTLVEKAVSCTCDQGCYSTSTAKHDPTVSFFFCAGTTPNLPARRLQSVATGGPRCTSDAFYSLAGQYCSSAYDVDPMCEQLSSVMAVGWTQPAVLLLILLLHLLAARAYT